MVTRIDYSGGSVSDVTYSYDDAGHRIGMADTTGTSEYTYDDAGRLTAETIGANAAIGYTYDDAGQLTGLTYPGSRDVAYAYDDAGQMTGLTDWDDNDTAFTYTLDGQLATQSTPDGVVQTRTYDLAGQTLSIDTVKGVTSLSALDYGFDDAGQLVSDSTNDYDYDLVGQLNTVDDGVAAADYAATPAGLLTATPAEDVLAYSSTQQLTSRTPSTGPATAYVYDGNGSRTSSTVAASSPDPAAVSTYTYTSAGAAASVTLPTAVEVDYTSDGNGLRATRTVGMATDNFVWSTVGGLPLLVDDGDHTYLYGPSSSPIAQVDGSGNIEYLHTDLLGTVRTITDETGTVTGTNTFDAFGNRTAHTGTADSALGFTGNWADPDTGLLYLRARDYDPATGQFLTVDPAVGVTRQPYAYASNSPLLVTDPTGLCPRWGGASVPDCTWQEFYSDALAESFVRNLFAVWAGSSEGVGFNIPMLLDDTLYCKYKDEPGYWAGDALGLYVAVATLGSGALARVGMASLARTAAVEAPAAARAEVAIDRAAIGLTISRQKQAQHVLSSPTYTGGGYFNSADDAQRVLDEFHEGTAIILGMKGNDIVVRSPTVIGYNVNLGSGFANQPTDVFFIKGSGAPAVVPYNPTWKP